MNERIRALYKKAHEDGYLNKTFNPEKFAELIVQEVLSKIEDEGFEVYTPVVEAVKKHFGVEL